MIIGGMNIKAIQLILFALVLSTLMVLGAAQDGSGFGHPPGYAGDRNDGYNGHGQLGDDHRGDNNWGNYRHDDHGSLGLGGYKYHWSYPVYYDYGWYPYYTYTYYPTYYYYTTPVVYPTYPYTPLAYNWFDPWWIANV